MQRSLPVLCVSLAAAGLPLAAADSPAAPALAVPTPRQVAWHDQERIQFVHFGIATWKGTEYDDGHGDLSKVDPAQFNGDLLCDVAQSWGARQILLVAKHAGGFCWWPTETTDYCTRSIPWHNGQGNLVKEVADACRRRDLSIGIYLYPDDTRFTRSIGRGGRTDDPARQDEWSRLFLRQWEEVLTLCGPDLVREVWLDGGCVIDLADILQRLAPNAVVFQGRNASIRWVGNEAGTTRDPNWNSLKVADLQSGGATQDQSTPDGDAWAPVECDTPLYDHNWFWAPGNERKAKSLEHLLHLYIQSAGRGSVMLLNSTPNTDGLIPQSDQARYRELGQAIERNFGRPLAAVEGVTGTLAELDLGAPRELNCADLWEAFHLGHRIRAYTIEGRVDGAWRALATGTAVGRRKFDFFGPVTADRVRVQVTASVGQPVIRRFQVHRVETALATPYLPSVSRGQPAKASSVHSPPYEAKYLVDGDPGTRWSAADNAPQPWVEIDLGRPRKIARATASELTDRVQRFVIQVRSREDQPWQTAHEGTRMGGQWQTAFSRVTGRYVRLHILEYTGPAPTLWEFQLYDRAGAWEAAGAWQGGQEVSVDLSMAVNEPGQYEVHFIDAGGKAATVDKASLWLEGKEAPPGTLDGVGTGLLLLNRTQAIGEGASTALRATLRAPADARGTVEIRPRQ